MAPTEPRESQSERCARILAGIVGVTTAKALTFTLREYERVRGLEQAADRRQASARGSKHADSGTHPTPNQVFPVHFGVETPLNEPVATSNGT